MVSEVPFLVLQDYDICYKRISTRTWSQPQLQLLSARWPAHSYLVSWRQSLTYKRDITATALQFVVKPRTDGLMGMKAFHTCSLNYKINLVLDFMSHPPYQWGRLDEDRKGKRNKKQDLKEELQVEAAWGRRAGWTQTTQPRGDAMPGARLLLAGPQGEARRGGLFRKESTKVGLTHWAEIGEC